MNRRNLLAAMAAALGTAGLARGASASPATGRLHRLVLHVDRDDPVSMKLALGNARNAAEHYAAKGERIEMEIVANGFGVTMLRKDLPVKAHLDAMREKLPDVALSACGNSIKMMERDEGKDFALSEGVRVVPAGIARLAELQEQGWSYVKP